MVVKAAAGMAVAVAAVINANILRVCARIFFIIFKIIPLFEFFFFLNH